jgi:glucokinase
VTRVIAVDIGGTKIAAAIVAAPATIQARLTRATPRAGGSAVLETIAQMVDQLGPAAAIGVGSPGVISDGLVGSATDILPNWAGCQVRAGLERLTGLPVAVENDVHAMARGELTRGAARGLRDVLFVSVGTGVGGALAVGGRIVKGPRGAAGRFAHLLVPGDGPIPCGCGRRDHLEAHVSGPAIAASYAAGADQPSVVKLPDIVVRMGHGDAVARGVIEAAADLLGRALGGLLAATDGEAIVLGGGVAQVGAPFLDPVTRSVDVPVLAAGLGTDAPLIGAAALALDMGHDRDH